ncbi:MAG: Ig-like domain repeat protein [Betaproteobacteria bacterium]|nr:Ig-like domain repeat protein [Betaproteobacteria bacterium]
MKEFSLFRKQFAHCRSLVAACMMAAALPAMAIQPSTTTLTANPNPAPAGAVVTLRASVDPSYSNLDIRFPITFGSSTGTLVYFTYTLTGGAFGGTLTAANLTDVTTPAAFGAVNIFSGGNAGDTSVVIEVTTAAGGMPNGDVISLTVPAIANVTPGVTPTVLYSFGFSPGAPFGSTGPTSVVPFTPGGMPTGTIDFQVGGVSITGCNAKTLSATATATCTTAFPSAGTKALTAVYSGDATNFTSTGTLSGGLPVTLALPTSALPFGQVGVAYATYTFVATGGTAPYGYAVLGGGLPPGLTFSNTGVLSGTPTSLGIFNFSVTAFDINNNFGTRSYSIAVTTATQSLTFTLPASSTVGSTVALNGVATSGLAVAYSVTTPAVCSVSGATLTLNAGGTCTVTASQAGDANFSAAAPVTRSIQVSAGGTIVLRSTDLTQTMLGRLSNNQLTFTALPDPGNHFRLMALVDINGNGIADLAYQDITQGEFGDIRVWQDYAPANDRLLRAVKLPWRVDAVGDLDGDGYGDLVFRFTGDDGIPNDTGVSYIWFTNGTGVSQVRKRGGAPLDWKLVGAADLNGDRAADIVYVSPTNQIRVLMATGSRTCANFSAGTVMAGYTAIKMADYSGSHRGDILIRNAVTGDVRLISLDARLNGLPAFTGNPDDQNASCTATAFSITALTYPAIPSDPTWQYYASADLNGDGIVDVIWLKPDGTLAVWLMNTSHVSPTVIGNAGTPPAGFSVLMP